MDDATLPDEELELPHFEERLFAELVAQQRVQVWSTTRTNGVRPESDPQLTDLGALDRAAPEPPRRRRRIAALAGIGAAAAVIAATFVVAGGDDDKADIGTQETPDEGAPVVIGELEADIATATEAAIATNVIHVTSSHGIESWADDRSKTMRFINALSSVPQMLDRGPSVPPALDATAPSGGLVPTRNVDHCRREYADTLDPFLYMGPGLNTGGMIDGLRDGTYRVRGTEVVDGRELLVVTGPRSVEELPARLRDRLADVGVDLTIEEDGSVTYDTSDEAMEQQALESEVIAEAMVAIDPTTYYVDPATNLPVWEGEQDGSTTTVEFLPRSAESLALLVPPIPEGYTQVERTALDDERSNLGCL